MKTRSKNPGGPAGQIKGIAISGLYGGSGIPLDESMEPVRPCLIWMDRRAARQEQWVLQNIDSQRLYEITRNGTDPYYGYTKILWIKDNEPENWAKTRLFLPPNAYVIYKMTDEIAVDYSLEDVKSWQILEEKILPNPQAHKIYNQYYKLYHLVYQNLKGDMKTIAALANSDAEIMQ